jgi:hypothetical protein
MTEPLYRIEELNTTGWETIDGKRNLPKEVASEEYRNLVEHEGLNPNRLRVRRDA